MRAFLLAFVGQAASSSASTNNNHPHPSHDGSAVLLESIPFKNFDAIDKIPQARYTWEVLITYVKAARTKIDVTAMYWDLVAGSGGAKDSRNFTTEELVEFGADKGAELQSELINAATRGVKVRVLCGFSTSLPPCSDRLRELQQISSQFELREWNAEDWYGGGIMHQKLWVFDDTRAVLGSANSDWLSLTQVKEMGIAFDGQPGFIVVRDLQKYFDRWWYWTGPDGPAKTSPPKGEYSTPCWEKEDYLDTPTCKNPFPRSTRTHFNSMHPMKLTLNDGESRSFISCSPPGVCDTPTSVNPMYAEIPRGREWDGAALIHTIMSAKTEIGLAVMDYKPSSGYISPTKYWPALNDAILGAVRRGVNVRMLVSHWYSNQPYWSSNKGELDLKNVDEWKHYNLLNETAAACTDYHCADGSLEIRTFEIPGWDKQHSGPDSEYIQFSRVNHAKFIVTDQRFNIGTSNMDWGYFHTTAGSSFNSDHAGLRAALQAAFDRDWASPYASPLKRTEAYVPERPETSVSV